MKTDGAGCATRERVLRSLPNRRQALKRWEELRKYVYFDNVDCIVIVDSIGCATLSACSLEPFDSLLCADDALLRAYDDAFIDHRLAARVGGDDSAVVQNGAFLSIRSV